MSVSLLSHLAVFLISGTAAVLNTILCLRIQVAVERLRAEIAESRAKDTAAAQKWTDDYFMRKEEAKARFVERAA